MVSERNGKVYRAARSNAWSAFRRALYIFRLEQISWSRKGLTKLWTIRVNVQPMSLIYAKIIDKIVLSLKSEIRASGWIYYSTCRRLRASDTHFNNILEPAFTCVSATNAWKKTAAITKTQDWVHFVNFIFEYWWSKDIQGPIISYSFKAVIDEITGDRNIICGKFLWFLSNIRNGNLIRDFRRLVIERSFFEFKTSKMCSVLWFGTCVLTRGVMVSW